MDIRGYSCAVARKENHIVLRPRSGGIHHVALCVGKQPKRSWIPGSSGLRMLSGCRRSKKCVPAIIQLQTYISLGSMHIPFIYVGKISFSLTEQASQHRLGDMYCFQSKAKPKNPTVCGEHVCHFTCCTCFLWQNMILLFLQILLQKGVQKIWTNVFGFV